MSTQQPTSNDFKDDDDYKKALYDIMGKSQDDFEKQLSFISAGALGLSLIFTEKIVKDISKADLKCLLVAGWILLAVTLFINLISHLLATLNCRKTLQEYHERNS